jgi:hypothetical protein
LLYRRGRCRLLLHCRRRSRVRLRRRLFLGIRRRRGLRRHWSPVVRHRLRYRTGSHRRSLITVPDRRRPGISARHRLHEAGLYVRGLFHDHRRGHHKPAVPGHNAYTAPDGRTDHDRRRTVRPIHEEPEAEPASRTRGRAVRAPVIDINAAGMPVATRETVVTPAEVELIVRPGWSTRTRACRSRRRDTRNRSRDGGVANDARWRTELARDKVGINRRSRGPRLHRTVATGRTE